MNKARWIRSFFPGRLAVWVCFVFGLNLFTSGVWAADEIKGPRVDPIRAFQFKYQQKAMEQAVRDYLGFLRKVAPGVEEIGSQYAVADMWMDQGNFEDAARLLKSLYESPTKDTYFRYSVLSRLAICLMRLSRYAEAAGYYKTVTDGPVKALVPEAMIGLALATLSAGDINGAYQRFREVTALYPIYKTHPRYMLPMGLIQWQMRKFQGALEYFLRDDRNPGSQYFAGLCYQQLRKFPEASGTFRRITQEYPDTDWADQARFELGETFYLQGDFLLAAHTFEDIYLVHRSAFWDHLSLYRLACCDVRMKKYALAEQRLWMIREKKMDPALAANVGYLLTESLAAQEKFPKIISLLRKGSGKRSMENTYRLIWARAAQGEFQKAVDLANDFLNHGEDPELTPRTLLLQAYAFERLGKRAEAFATYQLVAEHFSATPYAAKAAELSCINFFRAGEYKAISTQVSSLWRQVDPEVQRAFPETIYWMGHASMKLRDFGQAQESFKKFISLAPPGHPWLSEGLRAQALAFAMDKSIKEALPVLHWAYQSAQESENKGLMAKLTLDTANLLFNAGNKYEEAASYYRRLEQIDPKNERIPFALYQEALSLYRAEYYNDAAEIWEKIASQYPRDARAAESLFRASRTRFELGKYPEAVLGYQTLVRNFPKSSLVRDARFQIGQAYYNAKDWPKAIEAYMDFQTRFPTDPELAQVGNYIQLASYNSGMSVDVMEKTFRGKTKTPVLADVYWREGAKNFNDKKYDAACDNFQKILYEFPSSSWAAQASFYRGESLFLKENFKDAVVAYESFLQGFPGNANTASAQFHLGVSYFSLNNFDRSAVVFEEFSHLFPTDELAKSAALNVAISYARVGDVEKTTLAYLNYTDRYPDADDVGASFIQLGQFLEKVGQESRALEAYQRVPQKRPEYPQALYLLARLHKTLSEPAGERQAYQALQKLSAKSDPYRIAGLLALADIHLAANNAEQALAVYEDVLKNATDEASRALAQQQISAIRTAVEQKQ